MESNARARTLGAELRHLRKAKGLSLIKLGEQVGMDKNTISRNERGERVPSETEVASILGALGVVGNRRRELLALTREADKSNWLETSPGLPWQLKALIEHERVATFITDVAPLLVPGLLQVEDYTRSIMVEGGVPAAEVEPRVRTRMERQRVLTRHDPVRYTAIIDEAVLARPIGGRSVLAGQLRHLIAMAEHDNVIIRVVPRERGWYPGLHGSFLILENARTTPVVHQEFLRSGVFLDKMQEVQTFLDLKPVLLAAAASVDDSVLLISKYAKEFDQ